MKILKIFLIMLFLVPSICMADTEVDKQFQILDKINLPNLLITPGVTRQDLTKNQICEIKWGKDKRDVTKAMKRYVYESYGLIGPDDPFCEPDGCEVDHLIPRSIGGADDVKNLWPQPYAQDHKTKCGAHQKDRLEVKLHKMVCNGEIQLEVAQSEIAKDWVTAFNVYVLKKEKGAKYYYCE